MDERPDAAAPEETKADAPKKTALASGAGERRELEESFAPWRASVHRQARCRSPPSPDRLRSDRR